MSPNEHLENEALTWNNHANHLAKLGQLEQALAASQQAVRRFRQLAEERPGCVFA